MTKTYDETPQNFSDIVPYIIIDAKQSASEIVAAVKCYFYDACSFRKHMNLNQPEYLFAYIMQTSGIVVITRCIIMELCSNDNKLWQEHISYIKKLNTAGIKVLVIFEEDIFEAEQLCFSSTAQINKHLANAVKTVKGKAGTVEATLKSNPILTKMIFTDIESTDKNKYSKFFKKVRANKESGDSLGEELIIICMHILSNIPEINAYKYTLFSEDKAAISQLGRAFKNICQYLNTKSVNAITSAKLAQLLFEENIITEKTQVEEILSAGNTGTNIKILCSEKFDMVPTFKTLSCNELAVKISNSTGIHINY
jgi:hypothetical protein